MNYPNYDASRTGPGDTAVSLAMLSGWIDQHNADRDAEAALWGRLAKIGEEHGEVVAAMIAWTGQNPRKPRDAAGHDQILKELLDVAVTALAAYESMTNNQGGSMAAFDRHVGMLVARMRGVRE